MPDWPPRIVAASAVTVRSGDRLLVLKPAYKEGWTLPGGVIEQGESPALAALRELEEETGLRLTAATLRVVDYQAPTTANGKSNVGGLRFIFDAGNITESALGGIRLPADEIADYALLPIADALALLERNQRERTRHALEVEHEGPHAVRYLEDAALVSS